jgi:hypothetical protein
MDRFLTFTFTIPAGTAIAAPVTQALSIPDGIMREWEILIPPGPSGFMGFRLLHSGMQLIPYEVGTWIIANDETLHWPTDGFPTGDKWSVQGYNAGQFPHSVYLRAQLDEITTGANATAPALVQID